MGKGNRSYNQQVHHHPNTLNGGRPTKTFFLPMFCRLSINDVAKPPKLADLSSSSSSSKPDPSSPKISCIGQIKKRSNTTTTTTNYHLNATRISTGKSATNLNYTKLRKLFSSKNLIYAPVETATISNHGSKCISNTNRSCNRSTVTSTKKKHIISIEDPDAVRGVVAVELDPPLPVVKIHPRDRQVNVNLGKRRGIELKTLQIQQFQLSTIHSTKIIDNRDFTLEPPASS